LLDRYGQIRKEEQVMEDGRKLALAALGGALALTALSARRSRRYDFAGRSVVITGGSRGLGLLLARRFAEEGARLTLLARDPAELARAAGELRENGATVTTSVCDVRDQGDVERAVREVVERHGGVDVLVNNAGIIQVGPFDHMDLSDFEQSLGVHFWGPLHAVRAVLPHMRRRRSGRIVNIASIGGKIAVPHLLPYTASKFALVGLSEGLRHELLRDRIYVTTVCPGLMRTGSHVRAFFKGQREKEFGWFALMASSPITSIDGARAARQIVEACRRGDAELIITTQARLAVAANGLVPGLVSEVLSLALMLLPGPRDADGEENRPGWQSRPGWLIPLLTFLADRATRRNNEEPMPA
jgi:NAD(P)-dependent dehydrogenase (short-subunit alcohol dehydrogenase family)